MAQERHSIVLVGVDRGSLHPAARELAVQYIHRHLQGDLAHHKWGGVDRSVPVAGINLLQTGRVAVIAVQQHIVRPRDFKAWAAPMAS